MDEPTAALEPQETAKVGQLIWQLKKEGIGIFLISHFLISHDIHDVFDLCDRFSVLSNGRLVATYPVGEVTKDDVLSMIILGREPENLPKLECS
jgi:D-xylose transport system ATP-binding protein